MRARATVAVLLYRSIAAATTRSFAKLTVDPLLFEEHLAAPREQSPEVILFGEVPAALADGRRAVAITIDDGLADAADAATPALLRRGLSATLICSSGYVGACAGWLPGEDGKRPMLSRARSRSWRVPGSRSARMGGFISLRTSTRPNSCGVMLPPAGLIWRNMWDRPC